MRLAVDIESKEKAEEVIKQLQEFVNKKDILYPEIAEGKMFYVISDMEEVIGLNYYRIKDFDKKDLVNIYKTRDIAEKALEFKKSRKVWNFIENWVMHNSKFEPDWKNTNQPKFFVYYNNVHKIWYISTSYILQYGTIYLSKEEAEKLIVILNSSDEYKL